jgi:hypothetical protein
MARINMPKIFMIVGRPASITLRELDKPGLDMEARKTDARKTNASSDCDPDRNIFCE